MTASPERAQFLNLAGVFEGGLVFVALGLGWAFGIDIVAAFRFDRTGLVIGLIGALPPFLLLLVAEYLKIPPLERIKQLLLETLGPALAACRWYDLVLVAIVAGIGEEMLFRGVIQPLFERWFTIDGYSRAPGLILSNVIFGLLHLITPTYALLAGAMGVYFGVLLDATGSRNLLAPILAHALYDYLAFQVVIRSIRKEQATPSDIATQQESKPDDVAPP